MAKALIKPLDNLIRVPDNIQEIFDGIVEKEKANIAIDPIRFSTRINLIASIADMVSAVLNAPINRIDEIYEYTKMSILSSLNGLNNKGGIPNELNQVLSIDDFLKLSTYNLQERMDVLQCNVSNPMDFARIVTQSREMEKRKIEGVDGTFSVLNKSLQKAHSIEQKFANVGAVLSKVGIKIDGVLDIIYNYLEGFGADDAKNAISKIIFYSNDQVPKELLECVGNYLDVDEVGPLYVQPEEGKVFGILDQQFGDDGIAMFSTLPFNARSIILDYTGIEEYYICNTPAVLGEVDSPNS